MTPTVTRRLLTFCFLMLASISYGQGLTDSYLNFGVGYGSRPVTAQLTAVDFSISNAGTTEEYNTDFSEGLSANGLNIFFGFGRYKGISHQLFFDFPIGNPESTKFGYNIGYNIALEVGRQDFLIRPSVGIAGGDGVVDLVTQNYTEQVPLVFDTINVTGPVTFSDRRNVFTLNPGIDFSFLINQKYAIHFQAHYDLDIFNISDRVLIQSDAIDGDNPSYELSDIINLTSNGARITDQLIDYSGLRFSIGVSSYINKQVFNDE